MALRGIVAGDWNGDGKLDLAVADEGAGAINLLFGSGDGKLGAATALSNVPTGAWTILASDFDGDGVLDLAATHENVGEVSVMLGSAGGAFQPPALFVVGDTPQALALADWNGDGRPDLIAANLLSNDLSVLLNSSR
jgi:hypothetical protein